MDAAEAVDDVLGAVRGAHPRRPHKLSRRPLSVVVTAIPAAPAAIYTACDASGDCTQGNLAIVQDYFGAFRYGYTNEFWVNPDRFDVSVRVEAFDNRNLPEFLTGNSRDFIFHFDSWERPVSAEG